MPIGALDQTCRLRAVPVPNPAGPSSEPLRSGLRIERRISVRKFRQPTGPQVQQSVVWIATESRDRGGEAARQSARSQHRIDTEHTGWPAATNALYGYLR
jgi:hypothetical protein